MSATATFPAPRVAPHALRAFGGIWRLTARRYFTLGHWLGMGGMLVMLGLIAAGVSISKGHPYAPWAAGFYVCFIVPVLSFIFAAGMARDDLKAESVDYVLTRPVPRPAFVLFRYLSQMACAQFDFLFSLGVLYAIGLWQNEPGLADAFPYLLGTQVLLIIVFSAFGLFCGMLTSRYVIIGLVYGLLIEVGIGNVPTQLNQLSITRHALRLLSPVIGTANTGGIEPTNLGTLSLPATIALLLAIATALVAAAAALFTLKEFAGAASRDT